MSDEYDVHIRATGAAKLSTIVDLFQGDTHIRLVSIRPVPNGAASSPPKKKVFAYVGQRHDKGISGRDLVLKVMKEANGNAVSTETLGRHFKAHGFAPNSASPACSMLRREGVLEAAGKGLYRMAAEANK